jgi:hypothetical protein
MDQIAGQQPPDLASEDRLAVKTQSFFQAGGLQYGYQQHQSQRQGASRQISPKQGIMR